MSGYVSLPQRKVSYKHVAAEERDEIRKQFGAYPTMTFYKFYNFCLNTFNIADILHTDVSSIWREKVLDTTWHMDQLSIHAVACETLHITHTQPYTVMYYL